MAVSGLWSDELRISKDLIAPLNCGCGGQWKGSQLPIASITVLMTQARGEIVTENELEAETR